MTFVLNGHILRIMEIKKIWTTATDAWKRINPSEFDYMKRDQKDFDLLNRDINSLDYPTQSPKRSDLDDKIADESPIKPNEDYTIDFT